MRGVTLLDYSPGGPSFNPALFGSGPVAGCGADRGAGDEVHGESGDDAVYGGCGSDALFGDAGDDDLIGGWGNDFISGGTGQDGILGDDGRIFTSRVAADYGEPLHGVAATPASELDAQISAQLGAQLATLNVAGTLKKSVDLTPFGLDPAGETHPDPATNWMLGGDPLFDPTHADDIIFGGLGADFLHGGAGDDAISGAEALDESYGQRYGASGALEGRVRIDFYHPYNPGDALHFGPDHDYWDPGLVLDSSQAGASALIDMSGQLDRMGEFALYDEYDPRRKILVGSDGKATKDGTGGEFFLNFDAVDEGAPEIPSEDWGYAASDGDDAVFGDLGNDWLVGGTGRDSLWGGFGNDLLNADDNLETQGGLNDRPDTHPSYEDLAFGGAGLDILIANTGGDRLIDWQGDWNSFIVPFSWYSLPTVSRWFVPELDDLVYRLSDIQLPLLSSDGCANRLSVQLQSGPCRTLTLEEFLYQLSASQGADPTRAADAGTDPARRGEPLGELGLVTQRDRGYWRDQEGIPSDPPGLIPFQRRDVVYSAAYEDGTTLPWTTLENGLFGGGNVLDLLFGYNGRTVSLGILNVVLGGSPNHDLTLSLPVATLRINVTSIDVTLGTVGFIVSLGAPAGSGLLGAIKFAALLPDLMNYVYDAEDVIAAALANSLSGTTGVTFGQVVGVIGDGLFAGLTTPLSSLTPNLGMGALATAITALSSILVMTTSTLTTAATVGLLAAVPSVVSPFVGAINALTPTLTSLASALIQPLTGAIAGVAAQLSSAGIALLTSLTGAAISIADAFSGVVAAVGGPLQAIFLILMPDASTTIPTEMSTMGPSGPSTSPGFGDSPPSQLVGGLVVVIGVAAGEAAGVAANAVVPVAEFVNGKLALVIVPVTAVVGEAMEPAGHIINFITVLTISVSGLISHLTEPITYIANRLPLLIDPLTALIIHFIDPVTGLAEELPALLAPVGELAEAVAEPIALIAGQIPGLIAPVTSAFIIAISPVMVFAAALPALITPLNGILVYLMAPVTTAVSGVANAVGTLAILDAPISTTAGIIEATVDAAIDGHPVGTILGAASELTSVSQDVVIATAEATAAALDALAGTETSEFLAGFQEWLELWGLGIEAFVGDLNAGLMVWAQASGQFLADLNSGLAVWAQASADFAAAVNAGITEWTEGSAGFLTALNAGLAVWTAASATFLAAVEESADVLDDPSLADSAEAVATTTNQLMGETVGAGTAAATATTNSVTSAANTAASTSVAATTSALTTTVNTTAATTISTATTTTGAAAAVTNNLLTRVTLF